MKIKSFDAADYIDSEEMAAAYLAAAIEDNNPDVFIAALGDVARAKGMTKISESTGLGRESLYKSLRTGSKLRFETTQKILGSLGLRLTVEKA